MNAYRSPDAPILGQRQAEVAAARELLEPALPSLRNVRASRMARIVSGMTGIVGALVMVGCAIGDDANAPTAALLGSVAAMVVTWLLTRLAFGLRSAKALAPAIAPPVWTGHLATDLAAIDARAAWPGVERKLQKLEMASAALPLAALSLLLPLTLHYPVATLMMGESTHDFSKWIRISLVIVGFAHLVLLALSVRYAKKMTESTTGEIGRSSFHKQWAAAWGLTIAAGCVPGIVLLLVPPVLCALTGLAFIPFMFLWIRKAIMSERATIELAEESCAEDQVRVRVDPAFSLEPNVAEPLPLFAEEPVYEPARHQMRI